MPPTPFCTDAFLDTPPPQGPCSMARPVRGRRGRQWRMMSQRLLQTSVPSHGLPSDALGAARTGVLLVDDAGGGHGTLESRALTMPRGRDSREVKRPVTYLRHAGSAPGTSRPATRGGCLGSALVGPGEGPSRTFGRVADRRARSRARRARSAPPSRTTACNRGSGAVCAVVPEASASPSMNHRLGVLRPAHRETADIE